jgi:methylenetetrahydrofolate dehydrogenase (NADP+)/methenyltetrahydrofolate cyclohydrolase
MLTCKEYTELKKKELKKYIEEHDLHPTLVVIQVGDRPESNSYIRGKMRDCEEVGIDYLLDKLDATISQRELEEIIIEHNWDRDAHGIILQLPVPEHIDVKRIQALIDMKKDVDGFGVLSPFDPCTPKGVIDYLKFIGYEFEGKDALVIGRSDIVGKPLARMLTDLDCTVTLAHSKTPDTYLREHMYRSDITFFCINKIGYFDMSYLDKLSADYVDIGLGAGKDGKLCGNLNKEFAEYTKNAAPGHICISGTGGVGLLTRFALLENVVKACEMQRPHEFLQKKFNISREV